MTEAIVDQLEIVEIDENHRHAALIALRMQQNLIQAVRQQGAIGKACQRVVIRHVADAFLRLAALDRDAASTRRHCDGLRLDGRRFVRVPDEQRQCAKRAAVV